MAGGRSAGWWGLALAACAVDERSPLSVGALGAQPSTSPASVGAADASAPMGSPAAATQSPCSGESCCESACTECERCDESARQCIPICACEAGTQSTCYVIYAARGACGARPITCTEQGTWPAFDDECLPRSAEVCLAGDVDEDCDGQINEGCECNVGDVTTCAELQGARGVCAERTMTCTAEGRWLPEPAVCEPNAVELCDSAFLDENCDGTANESPPCERFVQIDAEAAHTCARAESGSAFCWGSNLSGQFGDGTTLASSLPRRVGSFTQLRSIAAGDNFGCAVLDDGTVQCWGDNSAQQLADGGFAGRLEPGPAQGLDSIFAISAAGGSACAIRTDSRVYCWGLHNPDSRSGMGGGVLTVPLPVAATQISTGNGSSCAVGADFRIYCWGSGLANTPPPLGDGLNVPSEQPVLVASIPSATEVDVSQSGACAVLFGGAVECWGANEWGQLGDGTTQYAPAPVRVTGLQALSVCTGGTHSCAVLMDGSVRCWGSNGSGQLGVDAPLLQSSLVPVAVVGLPTRANTVSCGFTHTCALLADSSTHCWGSNHEGQLGNGTAEPFSRQLPVRVHGPL
jgi:alpha-tubulin suppressor-like RCC1 family protein